jgi:hypothetical protein
MPDDSELRRLRDQVRNLEAQLAFARRGSIGSGGGNSGCVIGLLGVGALVVLGGAASFLLMRSSAPSEEAVAAHTQADAAARDYAARQQATCLAQVADLTQQLAQVQAAPVAPTPTPTFAEGTDVFDAHVTSTSGSSHVHVGDACRVDLAWTTDPSRYCRALIDCGDHRLYGDVGQGWLPCMPAPGGGFHSGEDVGDTSEDGDPMVRIDRGANLVMLSDNHPSWSIALALDPEPETH